MMPGSLLDLMPHVITIEPFVSVDGWGAPTYGAARTARARVESQQRVVRGDDGRERVSQTVAYVQPVDTAGVAVAIGQLDRVTLPNGFVPQRPPVLSVQPHHDSTGVHHLEVRL